MGIKRIDFGSKELETASGGKVKALVASEDSENKDVAKNGYLATPTEIKYKVAKTGNVGIGFVWKVTEEDAVDIDGNSYVGKKVWDDLWFGGGGLKLVKLKLAGLGVDVDTLVIEDEADVKELAEVLREDVLGEEFRISTENEEDNYGDGTYDDGTQKYKTRLKFINAVS